MNKQPVVKSVERLRRDVLTLQSSLNNRVVAINSELQYVEAPEQFYALSSRATDLHNDARALRTVLKSLAEAQRVLEAIRD